MKTPAGRYKTPPKPRSCQEFLSEWMPQLHFYSADIQIDFSWNDQAITITDMRVPSALRTGVLYTKQEVEHGADQAHGDFGRRVDAFLAKGLKG